MPGSEEPLQLEDYFLQFGMQLIHKAFSFVSYTTWSSDDRPKHTVESLSTFRLSQGIPPRAVINCVPNECSAIHLGQLTQ